MVHNIVSDSIESTEGISPPLVFSPLSKSSFLIFVIHSYTQEQIAVLTSRTRSAPCHRLRTRTGESTQSFIPSSHPVQHTCSRINCSSLRTLSSIPRRGCHVVPSINQDQSFTSGVSWRTRLKITQPLKQQTPSSPCRSRCQQHRWPGPQQQGRQQRRQLAQHPPSG